MVNGAIWSAIKRALHIRPPSTKRLRRALRLSSAIDGVKTFTNSLDSNLINPAAWVLGPVQNALGELLLHAHTVQRLVTWQDSAATTVLYLLLAASALLLALIPWAVVSTFVIKWGARLLGFALLGPHMYWVGLRLEAIAEQQQREADAAAAAAVAEAQAAAKQKKAARWKKVTSRGAAAPPVPPLERQGSQAAEDDAEGEDDYVFEMETSRKMPRQPCVPDVRSAFAFAPPPPMARQQGGAHGRSGQGR